MTTPIATPDDLVEHSSWDDGAPYLVVRAADGLPHFVWQNRDGDIFTTSFPDEDGTPRTQLDPDMLAYPLIVLHTAGRRDDVWTEVQEARANAHAKHGDHSIEAIDPTDHRWLSILVEEIGETAHELTYDATGSLRAELIDVLSVASAWVDAIDRSARGSARA